MERQLAELERLSSRLAAPTADLAHLRGRVAMHRGESGEALRHSSQAWQDHNGVAYIRSTFAFYAGMCSLELGRREDAQSWLQHLSATDQDRWEDARRDLRTLRLCLALFEGDHAAVVEGLEVGAMGPDRLLRAHLFRRAASLDPLDDPSDSSHPARKLARLDRKQNVHTRYDQLLALVDYRLACLRFTAGLPAVDDLYYQQPDAIPSELRPSDRAKLEQQLRGFRFT